MKIILGNVASTLEVREVLNALNQLRKYSDIAHIVAHSKNPDRAIYSIHTPQCERDQFNKFRNDLSETQSKVITCVYNQKGIDITQSLLDVIAESITLPELVSQLSVSPRLG